MSSLDHNKSMELTPQGLDAFAIHLESEHERLTGLVMENLELWNHVKAAQKGWMEWLNPNQLVTDTQSHHGHITDEDLAGCTSQRAALEKIACLSGGIVTWGNDFTKLEPILKPL